MKLLLENWREFLKEEAVMDISNLGLFYYNQDSYIILFNPDIRPGLISGEGELIFPHILGVYEPRYNNKWKAMEVDKIWAKKGYGPILYRLAIEQAGDEGLIPNQTGQISDKAKGVWKKFYEGGGQYVEVQELYKDDPEEKKYSTNKEDFLNVRLFSKGQSNIGKEEAGRRSDDIFSSDKYGEMEINLVEAADSLLRSEMDKIYNI